MLHIPNPLCLLTKVSWYSVQVDEKYYFIVLATVHVADHGLMQL